MRLWSLHPKYLDSKGLVALWREALLAQAVLSGKTRGYRSHPQLERFRNCSAPLDAISLYLWAVYAEAEVRGYSFDKSKLMPTNTSLNLTVTSGQIEYEWVHLMAKLRVRSPRVYRKWQEVKTPEAHPIFRICPGDIEGWERR